MENSSEPPHENRGIAVRLPEGASVERKFVDTQTHIEHGERTWTTGQTVRDVLQNHLDANTEIFFDRLVSSVIDTDRLTSRQLDDYERRDFDEFTHSLFRYKKGMQDLSTPALQDEMQKVFERYATYLPLREKIVNPGKTINMTELNKAVADIEEVAPQITFRIVDQKAPDRKEAKKWVSFEELKSAEYQEALTDSETGVPGLRYQIEAIKITDEGSGFDAKLTAFYKGTKIGKRHLRGKYSEGSKLCQTHIVRNGAKIKMRSSYRINSGLNRDRVWQQRAVVGEDNVVKLKGVEVDMPVQENSRYGSYTLIDIRDAGAQFRKEFIENVDPRIPGGGLAINCLDYSDVKYHYPMASLDRDVAPLGVSLTAAPDCQYVQGLRVGNGGIQGSRVPVFSYDFFDSSVLKGRDRSELKKDVAASQIIRFWRQAESPELIEELIERTLMERRISYSSTPEFDALRDFINEDAEHLSPQARRTQEIVLQLMPRVIGIEYGRKNVVISEHDLVQPGAASILKILETRGYHRVNIANAAVPRNFEKLNEYHQGEFEVYTFNTLRGMIRSIAGELDSQSEKVKLTEGIYRSAYDDLVSVMEKAGLERSALSLQGNPVFLETVDPVNELPLDLTFDEASRTFRLTIRPDLIIEGMKGEDGTDYWRKRMQVEMLAAIARHESFPDRNSLLKYSQENALLLLEKTLRGDSPDVAALPERFSHEIKPQDEAASMESFSERLRNIERSLLGATLYDQARLFETSFENMERLLPNLRELPQDYKEAIQNLLAKRLIIKNDEVGFFTTQDTSEGKRIVLNRKRLDDLEVLGAIGERKIYRAGNRLFVLSDVPKDSVIKMGKDNTCVMHQGKVLHFQTFEFGQYNFDSYPLVIDNGCFSVGASYYKTDLTEDVTTLQEALGRLEISPPQRAGETVMKSLEGAIETPLPVEYGKDEWDNPVRVFEDIVQNHIDASPDGRVALRYEVARNDRREWVDQDELTEVDRLTGIMITDNGDGYLPNDLGTMGKSNRKSPFFAGKYGEGQKMIAAACARNNFILTFSSQGEYGGRRYRWMADVGTQDEEVIEKGVRTVSKRVIFNQKSHPVETEPSYASTTILRLPEDPTRYDDPQWREWVDIFDPRQKDERGYGGLERCVINLRPENNPNIIDFGYMRILLDEPGAVYENGLLIKRDEGEAAVGYDVPEVVSTRERNSYDSYKLRNYIAHVMTDCRDLRYHQTLMRKFKDKYLKALIDNPRGTYVSEYELNPRHVFRYGRTFVSGRPFWDYVCATELGSYLVHSEEALIKRIEDNREELTRDYVSNPEKLKREIVQAVNTLANVSHVSRDHIINVPENEYDEWSNIFPTTEDYVMNLSAQEVPVDKETLEQLRGAVVQSAAFISSTINVMQETPDGKLTYDCVISGGKPADIVNWMAKEAGENVVKQLADWSDAVKLSAAPEAVFVAPEHSGYLGIVDRHRIGFNEKLLVDNDLMKIARVSRHELAHKIFDLADYTPEFIVMIFEMAKRNIRQASA